MPTTTKSKSNIKVKRPSSQQTKTQKSPSRSPEVGGPLKRKTL